VMTCADAADVREECFAQGADEFLNKPFDTELLIATMRRLAPPSLDLV
jgi:CheY-like chemotaxis protein